MINQHTIALFGESERGKYNTAHFCNSLPQLVDSLGNPPPQSRGLFYAVQALLYDRKLIYFRVEEEGFSYQDYVLGLDMLGNEKIITDLSAICLPGVGDREILDAALPLCKRHRSVIITTEPDLYDFLTEYSG